MFPYSIALSAAIGLSAAEPSFAGHPRAADTVAQAWLTRAITAVGMPSPRGAVLRLVERSATFLTDESDRTYAPYIMQPGTDTVWLDPATGVEHAIYGARTYIRSERATWRITDSGAVADPRLHGQFWSHRAYDPWIVLTEWARDSSVRLAGERRYRDYDRVVLTRPDRFGTDTLYLDKRTALPIRLARMEAHYFLGTIHAAYVYTSWYNVSANAVYPISVTRSVGGQLDESRYIEIYEGGARVVARDSAPQIVVPDPALTLPLEPQHRFITADVPDTVNASAGTYLLVSRSFTSVVSLQRDTIFVFDTPADQLRAAQDRAWTQRLFPGPHPIVLVAMNPVWPHIAGLRYWVAHGAAVVGSRPIVPYLRSVVAQRWTAMPDALEQQRSSVRPAFRAVDDSADFAGGRVKLYAMEGLDGETVLLASIVPSRFVWGSDHIQDITHPNIYVKELWQTVVRHAIAPAHTSGPHFRLIPWPVIDSLARTAEQRSPGPAATTTPAPIPTSSFGPAATVDAFLAALSGPAGRTRNREMIHGLLHPNARYWISGQDSAGDPTIMTVDPHVALDAAISGWEAHGFFERCAFHRTETWAGMAHVLCTYEIRHDSAGPVVVRGIDSAQLAYDEGRWLILSLFWHSETPKDTVPLSYRGPDTRTQ
jgi:hypothetical protein